MFRNISFQIMGLQLECRTIYSLLKMYEQCFVGFYSPGYSSILSTLFTKVYIQRTHVQPVVIAPPA